jgi:hypothetical protein
MIYFNQTNINFISFYTHKWNRNKINIFIPISMRIDSTYFFNSTILTLSQPFYAHTLHNWPTCLCIYQSCMVWNIKVQSVKTILYPMPKQSFPSLNTIIHSIPVRIFGMELTVRIPWLCGNLNFIWSYLHLRLSHECGFFRKMKAFDLWELTQWQGFKAGIRGLYCWAFSQYCKFWKFMWGEFGAKEIAGNDWSWFIAIWSRQVGRHAKPV